MVCEPVPPATSRCLIPGNGFSLETSLKSWQDNIEHWEGKYQDSKRFQIQNKINKKDLTYPSIIYVIPHSLHHS